MIFIAAAILLAQPAWADIPRAFRLDVCAESEELGSLDSCWAAYRLFVRQNKQGLAAERREDQRRRARLCRQERIAAREGLIGTAPTNEEAEAGIGEDNPTPMCEERAR